MPKIRISKGDKVAIITGSAKSRDAVGTVLKVDRSKGMALVEMPKPKLKRGEREVPLRGVEVWKTVRYNPQSGEAGGLKIIRRPIHLSNLRIVEKVQKA